MVKQQNPNLEILMLAVDQLGDLSEEMVFLGGCATGLLITDHAAPPIRVTKDVDAIVQVYSRGEYYHLSEGLREKGFSEDTSDGAPLCRWIADGVVLDVMPTDEKILGFSNRWYASAIEEAQRMKLPNGKDINLVSPTYFLITKLEAFKGRGKGDYMMSHDIEDIIAVLDGRPELLDEIKVLNTALLSELIIQTNVLLGDRRFVDSVYGHMPGDDVSQKRAGRVIQLLKEISQLKN